ncbi:hypothetical protein L3Y34_008071 [Caenorhabditis briggsae]|uniref:Uncharacterized protein n=1 Tax=Caenorhabditis briggsae TaxID=6238 RepID=A0AAE9D0Z9_CAEBR|nr:hypothetical protein L3Y34_008071 [Caenorhabditis briggsae]
MTNETEIRAVVDDILLIPTDDYLSVEQDESAEVCEIEIHSSSGDLLLVSITNFLMFSHRRPRNPNDIIVRNNDMQFILDTKPKPRTPHTSYRYGRDALSSSQIMLIGFFALNGSFIVFFLILSLCSAGIFYRCPWYAKNSKASRHTFIRYLREAIPPALAAPNPPLDQGEQPKIEDDKMLTVPATPPRHTRHRHSILSRINFQPAPALSEIEPEVEDREQSPQESICEPPAHQPEVFLRRQSLPFGLNAVPLPADLNSKILEKKTRFGSRAMSFQH